MALVRTIDVTELKPQRREEAIQRPPRETLQRERLRASLGERSVHKQIERAESHRHLRGTGAR